MSAIIKVLIVDDSIVVRHIVADVLRRDPQIEIVGQAQNGSIALSKVTELKPDIITMDIEMPVMDGIEAVRRLRAGGTRTPIIMFSTLTERGAMATLDALAAGATDYITKPSNSMSREQAMTQVSDQLIGRIKALVPRFRPAPVVAAAPVPPRRTASRRPVRVVAIGSSTGGPDALNTFFNALTGPLTVPAIVTQHMPPMFTAQLAARLDRLGKAEIREAADGDLLRPGLVLLAPGARHLTVRSEGTAVRARLSDGPPVNYCKPSVDVMIDSAVDTYGADILAVILTGMGADGRDACRRLVDRGGSVFAQDEASSVVWGMPGAVARAGLAEKILPVQELASQVQQKVRDAVPGRQPTHTH